MRLDKFFAEGMNLEQGFRRWQKPIGPETFWNNLAPDTVSGGENRIQAMTRSEPFFTGSVAVRGYFNHHERLPEVIEFQIDSMLCLLVRL
jgi:hypothetical protein